MLSSLVALLASCNYSERNKDASGNVKTRIPVPAADGTYSLQVVELLGLDNLWEMSGQYAQFYLSPSVKNGRLKGHAPHTRFIKSNDLYIAADSLSLQLATVYAHTQKLAALDTELGAVGVNKWPRDIGVAVRIAGGVQNNAFYDGDTDSMLFVPNTDENLPIAVNAGILAHEHFHSLFYKLVTIPLNAVGKNPQKISNTAHSHKEMYEFFNLPQFKEIADDKTISEQTAYHILLMRALNEGLADFWGWLYTGDTDFISHSIPSEKSKRSLKTVGAGRHLFLYNSTTLRGNVSMLSINPKYLMANLNNEAYTLGTQYSRILKILTETISQSRKIPLAEAQILMAKIILKTLENFKMDLIFKANDEFYDPSRFVLSLFSNLEQAHEGECEVISGMMNRNQIRQKYYCEDNDSVWQLVSKDNSLEKREFLMPAAPSELSVR
jgi:hypothetical protein